MKHFYFLFFCATLFVQSQTVEIKIISLQATNEANTRSYNLIYTISNLSDKTINFVLNPNSIIPIGAGSLNPSVYYKLYENNSSIDVSGVFTQQGKSKSFKDDKEMQKYSDSLFNTFKSKTLEILEKERKERITNNIQELKPKEERQYEAVLNWDKTRYFRNYVIEYYINETAKHYFELHINLMQDELLSKFTPEEKTELLKEKNIVKGWFTSPKVEIDFTE